MKKLLSKSARRLIRKARKSNSTKRAEKLYLRAQLIWDVIDDIEEIERDCWYFDNNKLIYM